MINNYLKMFWLADENFYEKAIFTRNHNEFFLILDELEEILGKRNMVDEYVKHKYEEGKHGF